jgi:hypothetical protein
MVIFLLGMIATIASPFTQMVSPRNSDFGFYEYHNDFTLTDVYPIGYFGFTVSGEKIVIEELVTNGSPVVIELLEYHMANTSDAILQNVTHIQHVNIVGTGSIDILLPVFRVTRQDNSSVQVHLVYREWMFSHQDNIITGPSGIELLAIPLLYEIYKNWGRKPNRGGYALLIIIILSAALIAPLYVFIYNHESALVKNNEILSLQARTFMLNASHPLQEFNVSIESVDPDVFVRIANLTTDSVPVSISFTLGGIGETSELYNVTTFPSSRLQFEIPTENITSLTVRVGQIAKNTTVSLSIETIRDVLTPRNSIEPYYIAAVVGLTVFVIALVFHQDSSPQPNKPQS